MSKAAAFQDRYRMIQDCHPDVELHFWTDHDRKTFEVRCGECNKLVFDVHPVGVSWAVTTGIGEQPPARTS